MSRRVTLGAFGALAVATVAAFFVTQHLKISTPLIAGFPRPSPEFIAPDGTGCGGAHRLTRMSFYLLNRPDTVAVYVVDAGGEIVRTLSSGRPMARKIRSEFDWNGRSDSGPVVPDGTYRYRIALLHQGRTIELTDPVIVRDQPPRPRVLSVSPQLLPAAGGSAAVVRLTGNEGRPGQVRVLRTDLPGGPQLVKAFRARFGGGTARWDGRIRMRPAAAGTYLVGLQVADPACNVGRYPAVLPPRRGSTPHAGVTVRYLAAEPPLTPVAAGAPATVLVDSRRAPYTWTLTRAGVKRPVGRGRARTVALRVTLPAPGLYTLSLRSGIHSTAVPLVASRAGADSASHPRVLVVLPALTWQGLNPVDDDGDGLPDTLSTGGPVTLSRVLASGLPAGIAGAATLLAWLESTHRNYDLTTDVALATGTGPRLAGFRGVILAGDENWLPVGLGTALTSFARGGGHVLSLGIDSLRRTATIRGDRAVGPSGPASGDVFGVRLGSVTRSRGLITAGSDGVKLFSGTAGAFSGFGLVQPLLPGPGVQFASAAVTGTGATVIAGLRLGGGLVVEVGLPGFAERLGRDGGTQELAGRLWQVMSR